MSLSGPATGVRLNLGGPGLRKKATGVGPWLVLDSTGQAQIIETSKHSVMRCTGLPARDLRVIDPILSYPSTVLARERAIVVNLEHVKVIITAQEVLLLNSKDPFVTAFVEKLQLCILRYHQVNSQAVKAAGEHSFDKQDGPKLLPFEFIALEACLEAACSSLDNEARTLVQEAHPALDKLTSKISTLNLERVREIKSRLVAITGRVQKVRDELEQLLDDEGDMAEMYLTHKMRQLVDNQFDGAANTHSGGTQTSTTRGKHINIVELEMLLEAFFLQIDATLTKLSTLREYVADTEDYINIMLDEKQNQLLQMGVMLTTATLVVSSFVVVAGVFGMNIHIKLFKNDTDRDKEVGMHKFLWTVGGGATCSIFIYVMAIYWYKNKGLL